MGDIEGVWVGEDVKVQLKSEGANTWRLSVKVANTMSCTVTQDGDTFSTGPVMSTKMMPVPRLEARETSMNQLLKDLVMIKRVGSQLRLSGGCASLLLDSAQE